MVKGISGILILVVGKEHNEAEVSNIILMYYKYIIFLNSFILTLIIKNIFIYDKNKGVKICMYIFFYFFMVLYIFILITG